MKNRQLWNHLTLFLLLSPALYCILPILHRGSVLRANYKWVWALLVSFSAGYFMFISEGSGFDSYRYSLELEELKVGNVGFMEYLQNVWSKGSRIDLYQPVITWLAAKLRFSNHLLFAVYGLFFGYFWFKLLIFLRKGLRKMGGLLTLVLILIALENPIWNINGVRMWTAVLLFVYGIVLLYFCDNEENCKYKWLVLFAVPLIHFSLLVPLLLLLLFRVLASNVSMHFLFGFYIISFFFHSLNLDFLKGIFDYLPDFLSAKSRYLDEDYLAVNEEVRLNKSTSIAGLFIEYKTWLLLFVSMVIYRNNKIHVITSQSKLNSIFLLYLFLATIFNFLAELGTMARYLAISNSLILIVWYFYLKEIKRLNIQPAKYNWMIYLFLPLLYTPIRIGLEFYPVDIFIFPGMLSLWTNGTDSKSIIEFLMG